MDVTTGLAPGACVQAHATPTLALPKTGLPTAPARPLVGEVYLADIGVPPALYRSLGLQAGPFFEQHSIVRLGAADFDIP